MGAHGGARQGAAGIGPAGVMHKGEAVGERGNNMAGRGAEARRGRGSSKGEKLLMEAQGRVLQAVNRQVRVGCLQESSVNDLGGTGAGRGEAQGVSVRQGAASFGWAGGVITFVRVKTTWPEAAARSRRGGGR